MGEIGEEWLTSGSCERHILAHAQGDRIVSCARQATVAGHGSRKVEARNVFVGDYDRSVDGNGRLALPSTFRDDLGERCYVPRDRTVASRSRRSTISSRRPARARSGPQRRGARNRRRATSAVNSSLLAIDKQGRITLDDESRRHAGLRSGGQVVIAGALNCLQIWRPSRYRTVRRRGRRHPARHGCGCDE